MVQWNGKKRRRKRDSAKALRRTSAWKENVATKGAKKKPRSWGRPPGIYSIGRAGTGEVSAVSEILGWEKVRVQIDSGAIDTVGPREVAKAFAMKETVMSKKGI